MLVTEFSTEGVAAPERFPLWAEAAATSHMRNRLRSNARDDFRARLRTVALAEAQLSALAFPHLEIARTNRLIRQADPEVWQVSYLAAAHGTVSLLRSETTLRPGDLLVLDSSRPYHGNIHTPGGEWSQLTLQIPRALLPLPEKLMQSMLAVPIGTGSGMGALLARWLTDLNTRAHEFTPADVSALTTMTLDLLSSVVARCRDAEDAMDPESRRRALQVRILDFTRRQLADPRLTPESIAAAHGISTRLLYTLFREQGLTVAAWIRTCRLERCRRDLADPRARAHTVHAVAARWGFTDPAHFSRAFRTAYGMTPTDYRHQHVQK
ncbi:AraC family transcriptional regulator [Streptomyces venezuelae]|uniref:AraC family transcriptional regulator n=1 Tax=Streptomyces venezuelae TaxID=54571 RepID=A0A5P2CVS8_STRVZ|nr:helix-turn-helix domain-containing protein [Streptomyces venezuelae]QES47002.1 AraC family transcriptional regulator [Streptomyces venezuelae]